VRVPIARLPFVALTRLEAESSQAFVLGTTHVTRMKASCEDAPYVTDKVGSAGAPRPWPLPLPLPLPFLALAPPVTCNELFFPHNACGRRPLSPFLKHQGKASTWVFVLSYARLDEMLPLAHECLAASRLPPLER
jgi:hypothetical protein